MNLTNVKAIGKLGDLPKEIRLNLGCGLDVLKGYINIDLYSENPEVVYMDVRKLKFKLDTVTEIKAYDILEHVSHRETEAIIKEWKRVLKPDGILNIRVPDFRLQCSLYLAGQSAEEASYLIFGGQRNKGDFHFNGFDVDRLRTLLKDFTITGFNWDKYNNIIVSCKNEKPIKDGGGVFEHDG